MTDRIVIRNGIVRAWQASAVAAVGLYAIGLTVESSDGRATVIASSVIAAITLVGIARALRVAWIIERDGMIIRNLTVSYRIPWSNVGSFTVDEDPISEGKFGDRTWRRHVRLHSTVGPSVRIRATLALRRRRADRLALTICAAAADHGVPADVSGARLRSGPRRRRKPSPPPRA